MPGLVDRLQGISVVGIGNKSRLQEFSWSDAQNVQLIDCRAERYSIAEQIQLPLAIPAGVDLFFSPYYTIPIFYRGPLAVTVHDMSHLVVQEITRDRKKRLYAQFMFRALSRRASLIFTISDFSKSEFLRLIPGANEKTIHTTPLGVSREWYEAAKISAIREGPYLVCVGNIKPYKNVSRLVEAFLKVRHRICHDLVIIGKSEGLITGESPQFFQRIKAGEDRIHLTGFVSHTELLSLVAHADALLMPSLYEGFGLPPVEAMAAGVPVVVSRAASMPEVCGEAAMYFDPLNIDDIGEKLVAIGSEPALRERLSAAGLKRSRLFTWQACSAATADAILGLLEPARSTYAGLPAQRREHRTEPTA